MVKNKKKSRKDTEEDKMTVNKVASSESEDTASS